MGRGVSLSWLAGGSTVVVLGFEAHSTLRIYTKNSIFLQKNKYLKNISNFFNFQFRFFSLD